MSAASGSQVTGQGSFSSDLGRRHRLGRWWYAGFQAATVIAIIALSVLLLTIINNSFGYVAFDYDNPPENFAPPGAALEDLPKDQLLEVLRANISDGLFQRLDGEKSMQSRSSGDIYSLIYDFILGPNIRDQWSLLESLTQRDEIFATVAAEYPESEVVFKTWLNYDFISSAQSSFVEIAGVRTAILGSLWTIAIAILFAFPIGVGAAIYLEEYAGESRLNRLIQTNINNLAGVPSIIYGILGLAIFVRALEAFTSGAAFGVLGSGDTANGRTILSAGLTLGLLILPLIIINAQEAIKAVPNSLRQASFGLGATRWQTVWNHVLPVAMPGILTGTILAISRAIGETAPLVVIGASTFIQVDPNGPFSKFTTLPIQIFQWTARPQSVFRNLAAAASLTLLALLLTLNASAIIFRNRLSRRHQ